MLQTSMIKTMSKHVVRTSVKIDRKLWAKFKAQCTLENKTVARLLEELIKEYLEHPNVKF